MNIVRKLVGRRPVVDESSTPTDDEGLSLMHLRKLFMEFIHSSVPLTLKEQEKKLYAMLPLFIKVFSNARGNEITERFGDVLQFAAHTSRLMVNEIRRHAVNKSNDNASASIMNFLVMHPEDQAQSGWNLLNSLTILANGESAIVECMIATQLPSTLVHCIYLFFELPPPSRSGTVDDDHVAESYSTVQKLFIQLLVRLCNQGITAQELVRTDDLFILFTAMTCSCKPYNIGWRTGICEVLKSITSHGLRQDVCNYIHAKSCVSLCISSMQRIQTKNPLEIVEMLVTLFSILKDSTAISSVLMDDFRSCHGYLFLTDFLLQLGEAQQEATKEACRNMALCVSSFTMVGFTALRPPQSIGAPFQDADFRIPEAMENGNTVRNIEAFQVLQTVFIKSKDSLLCQHILDCMLRIYTSDQVNYFILEPQRTLSTFIEKVNEKDTVVQEKVFKLLEFVACNLNWTPSPELISLSILFKNTSVNSSWICGLECLIQLASYKDKYKDVFRDVGLLEVLTNCLKCYCVALKEIYGEDHPNNSKQSIGLDIDHALVPDEEKLKEYPDYPMLLMECLRVMMGNCPENATMFRKCGGTSCVHNIVRFESARGEALMIIQELILNGGRDDLGTLLSLMHCSSGSIVHMKRDILRTIIKVFALNPGTRSLFREVGGFVYVMSVLISMEGAFKNEPSSAWKDVERSDILELFRTVFYVLTSAMQDEPANKTFFMDEVRYKGLADSLRLLGCFGAHVTSLPAEPSPVSTPSMKPRLNRTVSTRSSIYVDPLVPHYHPKSSLYAALHVLHCLLDMAMDSFTLKMDNSAGDETDQGRVYPLDVSCIHHPGAVTVLVELLPSINESEEDIVLHEDSEYQDALDLQFYVANRVQACLRSERNQQIMCQAGLPQQILLHCEAALVAEKHPLHLPLQRIFERLATQALTPVVLRDYLRLGHPLHCSPVEIHKVKCNDETLDEVEGRPTEKETTLHQSSTLPALDDPPYSSSSDLHKDSLIADFTETRIASGSIYLINRSRSSSTSSSVSGDEQSQEINYEGEELVVESPPDTRKTRKYFKIKKKSKTRFYSSAPVSPSSEDRTDGQPINGKDTTEATNAIETPAGTEFGSVSSELSGVGSQLVTPQPLIFISDVTDASERDGDDGSLSGNAFGISVNRRENKTDQTTGNNFSELDTPHTPGTLDTANLSPPLVNAQCVNKQTMISSSSLDPDFSPNQENLREGTSNETNPVSNNDSSESLPPLKTISDDPEDEAFTEIASRQGGGAIPLSRIKSLVSMTTPRDMHLCGTTSLPGFVEFNMSSDGFGCLFFPSISPHLPPDTALMSSMAGMPSAMIGAVHGIGAGERTFPPQAGMTFIAWVCVERFSSPYDDPHPIRILTICYKTRQLDGSFRDITCLNIRISGMDRSLVVGTEEEVTGDVSTNKKSKPRNEARFSLQDLMQEGYWHHIIVTLNRALIYKHSTATVYFDGSLVGTEKLRYVQITALGNSSYTMSSIDAYIGTRRTLRRCSKLIWQLGPCHFLEEPLQSAEAAVMYQLGPSYIGSFQSPFVNKNNHSGERETRDPIVAEANIVLGIHAHATSLITIAKLKKHFSKTETRAIARELGLSKRDNSTPIRLVHNTASHLQGPSRCLGGVIIGISGVRTFFPRPVAELVSCVGGTTTLLGLVAMASDVEKLYASVKALSCVLRHSLSARQDMERIKGYQILALLFKRKCHLLNTHILHLTFALVGTVDSEREMSVIPNHMAFKDLLCDFEVWTRAPDNLQKSLVAHFFELLSQSSQLSKNVELMQDLDVISKLLYVLKDETTAISTIKVICNVLIQLVRYRTDERNLLRFGQFLTWSLTSPDQSERSINMTEIENSMTSTDGKIESSEQRMGKRIIVRNLLIEVLLSLVGDGTKEQLDERFSVDIQDVLGFDWIMLFMKENVNCSTVVRALRLLVIILSEGGALERFREGYCNGGWLRGTETLSSKTFHVVAGFNVKASSSDDASCEVNKNAVNVPGFVTLNQLLSKHVEVPEIYHLVISLLLRHPVTDVDAGKQFDWDSLYHVFWISSASSDSSPPSSPMGPEKHAIHCAEAASVLLSMARMVCGKEWEACEPGSWLEEYPVTVVQFLTFLYHNVDQFSSVSLSQDFVEHLVAVVFPQGKQLRIVSTEGLALQILTQNKPRGSVVLCHDEKESLTRHPAKRLIMGFIRVLITDALTTLPLVKAMNLLDMVLESFPVSSKLHQVTEFQTEVLHSQMEYLLAGNLLANPGKVMACIFGFTARVVDKLWQDHFNLGYKPIFNFIISVINAVKDHFVSKDDVFSSLNRVILYQLSRQLKELVDFTIMLEFLHMLTANYRIVFSSVNNDADFIAGLCYWLLIMTGAILPESTDVIDGPKFGEQVTESTPGRQDLSHSIALLTAAAERVWEVFIQNKREVIENVFKTEFPKSSFTTYGSREIVDIPRNFKTMNLDPKSLGSTLLEPAKKIWDNFHISQIKLKTESPKLQQKSMKKQTMARLGRRVKKDKSIETSLVTNSDMWTVQHIDLVKKLFQHQYRNYLQNYKLIERSVSQEWSFREDDLTRVRGLWGPPSDSRLDKWMLDMVEGPCRMRKKMCRNDAFYDHYRYKPDDREEGKKPSKFKTPMSFDSKLFAMLSNQKISALENETENRDDRSINDIQASCSAEFDEVEANENNDMEDQTIVKLLEAGEKIRSMFRCARVEGLDHAEGLFLFGQSHFYVVDGVTLLSTKEIKDIDSIPPEAHDPIVPRSSHDSPRSTYKKICSTWAYEAVREVHKRRYLLQETGLEVFSSDGRNHFLVFPKSSRNKVYNKMLTMIPTLTASPTKSVAGMRPDTDVESGVGLINSIMGEKSVTQRWERGEISNFQYLMHLNTLAGRSYNDLMQYPVFPWIIADYSSEELDLNDPATFRDLSKPMGAQTEARRKDFEKRYREWDDPNGETPPCHYATHYSSAMVVASYLVRMEPFAQHFLRLQDGHFDLPDRMFHSIKDAWLSASETNMADIKELIPEFFYLPEFLVNENRFDLGHKQSGVELGDVVLPPWAKGDPREFIRLHRKALECDYVSSRLHEWIDLIFGCKQRGSTARDAVNVFHHWFYEGNADISNIQDPLRRSATIGFINNFGQTPKQLFKRPHIPKKAFLNQDVEQSGTSFTVNSDKFLNNFGKLVPSTQPVKEIRGPVGEVLQYDNKVLAVKRNQAIFPPPCNQYVAWGFGDLSLRIGQIDNDKVISVMEDFQVGQVLCAVCPDARTLITGGTNTLVCVWIVVRENLKDKRPQLVIHEVLYGHLQPVTCLSVSTSYNLIVSGSEDMTCIIWDLNKLTYVRQLRGHISAISAISINNMTGDIVTCAGTYLYLWSVNGQLIVEENTSLRPGNPIHCCVMSELTEWDEDVILTGDQDGVVKLWTVEYFNERLNYPFNCPSRMDSTEAELSVSTTPENSDSKEPEDGEGKSQIELGHDELLDGNGAPEKVSCSFSNEYVIIDHNPEDKLNEKLESPALWKRRLVMRSQLTMHTAFSREDNRSPAAVTSILISKDHKKLYVGDARGRVYSWSVSDTAGRADHWVKDESSPYCTGCNVKFSFRERKHHCRDCGKLYCSKCSDFESKITRRGIRQPVRVCFRCYANLKSASKSRR